MKIKISNPITPWVKNTFRSKVNLALIAAWLIASAFDFYTDADLTGGIAFFGAVMLGYMLDLSRVTDELKRKS